MSSDTASSSSTDTATQSTQSATTQLTDSSNAITATQKLRQVGNYLLGPTLGQGSFGKVKLATNILSNERLAIKIVDKCSILAVDDVERVYRETFILTQLKHNNIIRLHDVIDSSSSIMLVMEYANGGDLYSYVMSRSRLSELDAYALFIQVVNGVEYCHRNRVIHRDLKLENILLDKNKQIKIADFGLSNSIKFLSSTSQYHMTNCGTPSYTCPEQIQKLQYTGAGSDIWAMGVILFAMVSGFLPFEASNIPNLFKKITKKQYKLPSYVSTQCGDLIDKMLTLDPDKRITLSEMRAHPWLCMDYTELSMELSEMNDVNPVTQQQIYDARQQCINIGKLLEHRSSSISTDDNANNNNNKLAVNDDSASTTNTTTPQTHKYNKSTTITIPSNTHLSSTSPQSSPAAKLSVFDRLTLKSPTTATAATSPSTSAQPSLATPNKSTDKVITLRRSSANTTQKDRSPRLSHEEDTTHNNNDIILHNTINIQHNDITSPLIKKTLNIRLSTGNASATPNKLKKLITSPSANSAYNNLNASVPRYMQSTQSANRQHDTHSSTLLSPKSQHHNASNAHSTTTQHTPTSATKPSITIIKSNHHSNTVYALPSFMQSTATTNHRNAAKPNTTLL